MKHSISFLCLLFVLSFCQAQSIERKLIGNAGQTLSAGGFQLSYSVGETVILPSPSQTLSFPSNAMMVSIGFQQPHVAKTFGIVYSYNWVSAYPNPTTGLVRLDIHGDNFQANTIKVFNELGQQVAVKPFVMVNGSIELNLSNVSSGVYIIAVTDNTIGNTLSVRVLKQNR